MKVTILGCGTSRGVPSLPESWGNCDPDNPKNRRRRASILVEQGDTTILIDTSPDLREQMLSAKADRLDAVFYTHDHADHTHGIDDLRGFFLRSKTPTNLYADEETLKVLQHRFGYIFKAKTGYPAICKANELEWPTTINDLTVIPFLQQHGPINSIGYRVGDIAYSTDVSGLDDAAFEVLDGVKLWIVDALRRKPHPTHSHLDQTIEWIKRVNPERAILTHMMGDLDYQTLCDELPDHIRPAYDGLTLLV